MRTNRCRRVARGCTMIPGPSGKTATKTNRRVGIAWLLLAAGLLGASSTHAQDDDGVVVLTALPATYSVAHGLADGTGIVVENLPERGRRMSALPNLLNQSADRYADTLSRADAVVTIGKLWREDPLFIAARRFNIRVIDIDATKPWSTTLEGISVALEPRQSAPWAESDAGTREPSVHYWLSPANGARMAEIIAADLLRLSPEDQAAIEANLAALRRELLGLKVEYELKFAELADVTLFALASEFVYLTNDMGPSTSTRGSSSRTSSGRKRISRSSTPICATTGSAWSFTNGNPTNESVARSNLPAHALPSSTHSKAGSWRMGV